MSETDFRHYTHSGVSMVVFASSQNGNLGNHEHSDFKIHNMSTVSFYLVYQEDFFLAVVVGHDFAHSL